MNSFNDSIRGRLVAIFIGFLMIGNVVNIIVQTAHFSGKYANLMSTRGAVLAENLRLNVEQLLRLGRSMGEMEGFGKLCAEMTEAHPDISTAFIVDRDGRVIHSNDPAPVAAERALGVPAAIKSINSARRETYVSWGAGGRNYLAVPIFSPYTGAYLGAAGVGYQRRRLYEELGRSAFVSVAISLAITFCLIYFFFILITRWMNKPILKLVSALELARRGNMNALAEVSNNSMHEFRLVARGFASVYRELSENREEIKTYSHSLESLVMERTSELEAVNETLREHIAALEKVKAEERDLQNQLERAKKLEAVGNLASGVAHDLNNILSGFVNYPELMLMELPNDSPLIRHIMAMKKAGERAAVMVQDLMTLARRGVALNMPVNMELVLKEFAASLEVLSFGIQYPLVKIRFEVEPNLRNIMGVPFHISKVLMNLVTNALESIRDEGEVTVSARNMTLDEPRQGFESIPAGEWLVLSVSDSGIGIRKEDMEKIFEPFYTKKVLGRRSGTGLGMTVVYSTVKDHRGFIDIESETGKGTTISLFLPPTGERPRESKSRPALESYLGRGERILIVDDTAEQREIVREILLKLQYVPITASSGEEGVEYLGNNRVDLVILDMIMDPGIDGYETYLLMKEIVPNLKAVIASGYAENERVKALQEAGAGAFVKKPYLMESLGLAIRDMLDK